jgi:hypothetical protein
MQRRADRLSVREVLTLRSGEQFGTAYSVVVLIALVQRAA